jgi:fused signal recognition particle receptor
VARLQAERIREEQRAFEAARIAREAVAAAEAKAATEAEAAEAASARAGAVWANRQSIAEIVAARKAQAEAEAARLAAQQAAATAERERQESLAARLAASAAVAETNVAQGVRFAWDFEVYNEDTIYRLARDFVSLDVKRAPVLAWLKSLADADVDPQAAAAAIGIRAFQKPVVSSR